MGDGDEMVIDLALFGLLLVAGFVLISTFFPALMKSINDAIANAAQAASNSAIQAAGAAAKGAVYGAGEAAGADKYQVDHTFSGNPSPLNDFLYGPDKHSLTGLWGAFKGWWQETWNPALGSGASGPSAGGFPIGTDVSNYNAGNWGDAIYAPPPPDFGLDQPTQDLLNYLGVQS